MPDQQHLGTAGRVVRSDPRESGWRPLDVAPAEAHPGPGVAGSPPVLATIVHLSDVHICDAESPARLEHLDRHADAGEPYADVFTAIGTYRPQEILTAQVALAMVAQVNALQEGPLAHAAVDGVLITGDVVDNAQRNELATYAAVFGGGEVHPRSGDADLSSWVGASTAGFWSDRYWHPDGPHAGHGPDRLAARFGYPLAPGLVEAARARFDSPGLAHPWFTVHGNHDALLQGTVVASDATRALALGDRRVVGLAPGQTPFVALEATSPIGPARYAEATAAPSVAIAPDAARAPLHPGELARALAGAVGNRGFAAGRTGNHWGEDLGGVRLLAIDTVNPWGGWEGSIDEEQLDWLRAEIAVAGRPVVITSHHPSWTLRNGYAPADAPRRVLAEELMEVLRAAPDVVAWVAGHVHANTARLHPTPHGGLLELTTASLIDWPQQGRVIEILADPDGGVTVAATLVEHAGPVTPGRTGFGPDLEDALADPIALAGLSRELAGNDYRSLERPAAFAWMAGIGLGRNAVWRVPRTG